MILSTLRKKKDFQSLKFTQGLFTCPFFVARFRPVPGDDLLFGFIVTKKMGIAVKRNRIRRRLKGAVRGLMQEGFFPQGWHILFIARHRAYDGDFSALVRSMRRGLAL